MRNRLIRIKDSPAVGVFACFMAAIRTVGPDFIAHGEAGTIPGLFAERVRRSPDTVAYRTYDATAGAWLDLTWREMERLTGNRTAAIAELELAPGDRVGLLLHNGPDWVAFDIAAMTCGLVTVPLYLHDSAANIAAILAHAGCRLLVVDSVDRWEALARTDGLPDELRTIWLADDNAGPLVGLAGQREGRCVCRVPASRGGGEAVPYVGLAAPPGDLATIVYTSGTTARPKGVMLSHAAILWNAEAVTRFIAPQSSDTFLSLLPLAHAFERTLGYYLPMMAGASVGYARSPETLVDDFASLRPTIFLGVPRVYERIAGRIRGKAGASGLRRWLLERTAAMGWRVYKAERGRAPRLSIGARMIWPVLRRLVASRVMAAFGGRLRIAVSGGARLSVDVARLLCGLGIPLVEGYGLTEAAPVVTATTFEDSFPGSVGRPLHGVAVRLGPLDELMVRSPSIMLGYWRDDAAKRAVLDDAGWLHTGDIARIEDGRVFILGRLKEIIVLSTGENIAATDVEAAIAFDPLIDHVCVVGDGRPCLAAIVVPESRIWRSFAAAGGFDPDDVDSDAAARALLERIGSRTTHLSKPSQVRAVIIAREPWTAANGVLTPTLKVKRRVVEKRYAKEIDAVFAALERERRTAAADAD